jgi:hypothetical protein
MAKNQKNQPIYYRMSNQDSSTDTNVIIPPTPHKKEEAKLANEAYKICRLDLQKQ